MIDEDLLVNVMEAHVQRLQGDDCVVGVKLQAFRRKFDAIIAELGLESLGLALAGLRAGGATCSASRLRTFHGSSVTRK